MKRAGVILVHGVGFQPERETFLVWTNHIATALDARASGPPGHSLLEAGTDQASRFEFARLDARSIPGGVDELLVTEAHWAGRVFPPSVPTITSWLAAQGGLALVARGIRRGFLGRLRLGLLLAGVAAAFLSLYSAIRAVAVFIPIAGVRQAILQPFETFLTGWAGDMWVLVQDPLQAEQIRRRVLDAVDFLRARECARITIVAHSGGAVVALGALSALSDPTPVDRLVTFGQGLNIAWKLLDDGSVGADSTQTHSGPYARRLGLNSLDWHDFWASDDPVPAGRVNPPASLDTSPASYEVWNLRNARADHAAYWENTEEFVTPLLQLVAQARPATHLTEADRRRLVLDRLHRALAGALAVVRRAKGIGENADAEAALAANHHVRRRRRRVMVLAAWRRFCLVLMVASIGWAWLLSPRGPVELVGDTVGNLVNLTPLGPPIGGSVNWRGIVPNEDWAWWVTAVGIALLLIVAFLLLLYVLVPVGRHEWTSGYVRVLVWTMDYSALFLLPLLLVQAGGSAWRQLEYLEHQAGVDRSAALLVVGAALAFGLLVWAIIRRPAFAAARPPLAIGALSLTLLAVPAALPFLIAPFAYDPQLGRVTLGGLVVVASFTLIARLGTWRWRVWDHRERVASFASVPGQTLSPAWFYVELHALGFAAVSLFFMFAADRDLPGVADVLRNAAVAALLVAIAGVAIDVVRPIRRAYSRGAGAAG